VGYGWDKDPFAKGTWCTWRPNWYRKYGEGLRDGPEGRLYFASSDYCEGSRGYIDGAIGSGIKAAQQISDTLG
jgi:monoamine oxidase